MHIILRMRAAARRKEKLVVMPISAIGDGHVNFPKSPSLRGSQRVRAEARPDDRLPRRSNPCPNEWRAWIASRSLSSGAHSRDPLARNDGPPSTRTARARNQVWAGHGLAFFVLQLASHKAHRGGKSKEIAQSPGILDTEIVRGVSRLPSCFHHSMAMRSGPFDPHHRMQRTAAR